MQLWILTRLALHDLLDVSRFLPLLLLLSTVHLVVATHVEIASQMLNRWASSVAALNQDVSGMLEAKIRAKKAITKEEWKDELDLRHGRGVLMFLVAAPLSAHPQHARARWEFQARRPHSPAWHAAPSSEKKERACPRRQEARPDGRSGGRVVGARETLPV